MPLHERLLPLKARSPRAAISLWAPLCLLAGAALCLLAVGATKAARAARAQAPPRPPVVLISIDGLKPDYVLEADRHGLKIPHLRRLVAEGTYAKGVTGVVPTVTYPSHATMLTGVSPAKHGVYSNTPFDPFGLNQSGWYWYAEDFKVPTLWDAAKQAGLVTASVDWPVSVGANVTYNIAQIWRARTSDDRKLIRAVSTPGLVVEAEKVLGPYHNGDDYSIEADGVRTAFNVYILEHKKPQFQTVYFGGLDHEEHDYGPDSPQAYVGLEKIDAMVGRVRAAAEKIGGGRAVICVVSDHGFARTDKEVRVNAALRDAGLIELDDKGKLKSWRAMAWIAGGSAAVMLKDAGDNEARAKAREALKRLSAEANNGVHRVLEGDEALRLGGFPDAVFLVGVKPGYYLNGNPEGPLVKPGKAGGTHGFLPELAEMNSSFFIAGPGIAAGRNLGQIDMRDVAPTLAAVLGVKLPTAEGRDVLSGPRP
jgi:predicted AlkP superfamily pyrophosphatase or phosphodiesterase